MTRTAISPRLAINTLRTGGAYRPPSAARSVKFAYYAERMSVTRMMILGIVQWMQPVHGYDVRRELLSWSADKWANVQPGSIYHGLRKLAEEDLLREVATEQVGA